MNHDNSSIDRRFLLGGLAGAAGVTALAAMSKAGPLNPPVGAVASTAKPLAEVEPRIAVNATNTPGSAISAFRITQPGSYYLTGNIQGVAGKNGIEITVSNVTLDLCGFTVQGVAGTGDGILGSGSSLSGVTVLNGHVRGWGASGVTFFNSARNVRVSGIHANGNTGSGIFVDLFGHISDCHAFSNGSSGIEAATAGLIDRCISTFNAIGISVNNSCTVNSCTTLGNTAENIRAFNRNTLTGNTCRDSVIGIRLYAVTPGAGTIGANHVEQNMVANCTTGFLVESGNNLLTRNTGLLNPTHWNVVNGNYLQVVVPTASLAFNAATGGNPLAPASYDPNVNFTIA